MKKIVYLLVMLAAIAPTAAFARGGGPAGSAHVAPHVSTPHVSTPHVSAPSSGFSSRPSTTYVPRTSNSGSYFSGGTTQVYHNNGMNFWFWMWLINRNNDTNRYHSDSIAPSEHMPYVLIVDKSSKDYMLIRYIGPDNKTEKVSPQEAEGLSWLKDAIKF